MNNRSVAHARCGAAALVVTSCLVLASVTNAAPSADGGYSGTTSQRRSISFRLSAGAVRRLRYRIDDRCPAGRRLIVRAWGFPALKIAHHRFGGTFVAKPPASAKAVIAGTVSGATVRGTLFDHTRNRRTHRLCTGRATFSLKRHAPSRRR